MKNPEEIKKGLECCCDACAPGCPYWNAPTERRDAGKTCEMILARDALTYIQQLEAQAPRWIPVEDTEHKPMHGKDYLCVCTLKDYPDERWLQVLRWYADENGNGYVQRPHFTDEGCCGMLVTHWSEKPELPPLPEAPKEDEK